MQSRTHARTHASMPLKYTPPKPKNPFHKSKAKLSKQASSTSKTRLPPKKKRILVVTPNLILYLYLSHPSHPSHHLFNPPPQPPHHLGQNPLPPPLPPLKQVPVVVVVAPAINTCVRPQVPPLKVPIEPPTPSSGTRPLPPPHPIPHALDPCILLLARLRILVVQAPLRRRAASALFPC